MITTNLLNNMCKQRDDRPCTTKGKIDRMKTTNELNTVMWDLGNNNTEYERNIPFLLWFDSWKEDSETRNTAFLSMRSTWNLGAGVNLRLNRPSRQGTSLTTQRFPLYKSNFRVFSLIVRRYELGFESTEFFEPFSHSQRLKILDR